jgi:prephenate dehydrogenase
MINVCLVGVGLIGGSLGMGLRRVKKNGGRVYSVMGLGRSPSDLKKAKKLGAIDTFSLKVTDVSSADIVVLCVPVQFIPALAKKIIPHLKSTAVLTDVGSVKADIVSALKKKSVSFVGAHPLAGSEKSGVANARADLFKKAVCVVTIDGGTSRATKSVETVWRSVGAEVVRLTSREHDDIVALTSHLPHLMAFSLFSMAQQKARQNPLIKKLAAGSFSDMTRIALSDPHVWTGIFQTNKKEILKMRTQLTQGFDRLMRLSPQKMTRELQRISSAKKTW